MLEIGETSDVQSFLKENRRDHLDDHEMVRRFSLSLRSPPSGSIASEILQQKTSAPAVPSAPERFLRAKSLISEVKEKLSDFESCISSGSCSEDDGVTEIERVNEEFKNVNGKKKGNEHFPKKVNMNSSPQN